MANNNLEVHASSEIIRPEAPKGEQCESRKIPDKGIESFFFEGNRRAIIWLCTLATLASGFVNLFSVVVPPVPERIFRLTDFIPLEFAHISRLFALAIGFALIISSINIYKRKKRALYIVFLLGVLSVVSHLTKGLDYKEAIVSFLLLSLLFLSRKSFTVKSSLPELRWALLRFTAALFIVFLYGTAGFWYLDVKDFGINFHWNEAIYETLRYLALIGDSKLIPYTRHARWFLDSLKLITAIGIGYSIFALYRPVRYRFLTLPREREQARKILEQHSQHALDYFKIWTDKSYFFSASGKSFLAYSVSGNFAVVLGDPVGPPEEINEIVCGIRKKCEENDWRLSFHQTLPDFLPLYEKLGFKKLKIGDDAIVDLNQFETSGKKGKEMRYILNKMKSMGISIKDFMPPVSADIMAKLKEVSDEWLQIAGRRERKFTLGLFEPNYVRSTEVFAAVDGQGKILGFVNIVPSYKKGEVSLDLMRRRTSAPNGLMDYIFINVLLDFKERDYRTFNLGLAPMSGFREGENVTSEEKAIHYFFQHMQFLFSYKGLKAYKAKFASYWEPRYLIYQNALDLPRHAYAINSISKI